MIMKVWQRYVIDDYTAKKKYLCIRFGGGGGGGWWWWRRRRVHLLCKRELQKANDIITLEI